MSVNIQLPTMSEEEWQESVAVTTREWERVILPPGWRERPMQGPFEGARGAVHGRTSLIFSAGKHEGKWWLHVSIAHPEKVPSYLDLAEAKRIFIGRDRQAIQLFVGESEHVNIHSRALHLWACLEPEGDGLPHFGKYGTI